MGWSTSAPTLPSGSGWSTEVSTGNCWDQFYKVYAKCAVARGSGSTIYVRFKLYGFLKVSGEGARSFSVKCQLSVGGGSNKTSDGTDCGSGNSGYDHWTQNPIATWYYTGTASPGTSIKCRLIQEHNSTDATLTAPALITYAVTYDGNGADGGSTAAQSKVNGEDLVLRNNGFTRNGWAFTKWNTDADGSGTGYAPGDSYTANAALALYAQWEQTELPVYVNVDGGVKRIAEAYMNVNGVVKECSVYMNVNGEIKELV